MAVRTQVQMLSDLIEGLNEMEGAAGQLVTQQQNPKWMAVRDMVQIIKDGFIGQAVTSRSTEL